MDCAEKLVGGPLDKRAEIVRMINPVTYVRPGAPPFLILHGDNDEIVPFSQSEILYNALRKARVEATLIKVKNATMGFHQKLNIVLRRSIK